MGALETLKAIKDMNEEQAEAFLTEMHEYITDLEKRYKYCLEKILDNVRTPCLSTDTYRVRFRITKEAKETIEESLKNLKTLD